MNVLYSVNIASACPFVKTNHIFRIVVGNTLQVAEFALTCGFIIHQI